MTEMNITEIGFHVVCPIEDVAEILGLFSEAGVEPWCSRELAVQFAECVAESSDFVSIGIDEDGDLVVATAGYFTAGRFDAVEKFRAYVNGLNE